MKDLGYSDEAGPYMDNEEVKRAVNGESGRGRAKVMLSLLKTCLETSWDMPSGSKPI